VLETLRVGNVRPTMSHLQLQLVLAAVVAAALGYAGRGVVRDLAPRVVAAGEPWRRRRSTRQQQPKPGRRRR
jgi:hypothetical protein